MYNIILNFKYIYLILLQLSHCNDKFLEIVILRCTSAFPLAYSESNNLFDIMYLEGILNAGRILTKNCLQ